MGLFWCGDYNLQADFEMKITQICHVNNVLISLFVIFFVIPRKHEHFSQISHKSCSKANNLSLLIGQFWFLFFHLSFFPLKAFKSTATFWWQLVTQLMNKTRISIHLNEWKTATYNHFIKEWKICMICHVNKFNCIFFSLNALT